jgi:hypothetical protein
VFLTAKTTAMVCRLFVGSALFSAVFALLGGQQLVEHWVLSFNLSPVQVRSSRRRWRCLQCVIWRCLQRGPRSNLLFG